MIYHCYGGAHSSVVAAHLHLGSIPLRGKVSAEQILALPEFDRATADDWGKPHLIGLDELGNEVYILGLGRQSAPCARVIISLGYRLGTSRKTMLVNTLPTIGVLTRIGGFSSRVLGFKNFGQNLAAQGIITSLEGLRSLVIYTKKQVGGVEH